MDRYEGEDTDDDAKRLRFEREGTDDTAKSLSFEREGTDDTAKSLVLERGDSDETARRLKYASETTFSPWGSSSGNPGGFVLNEQDEHMVADAIKKLPPLPRPRYWTQLGEASVGVVTVLVIIGFTLEVAWSFTSGDAIAPTARLLLRFIISAECCFALFCLLALLFGDPGVIRRSPNTCIPIPEEVQERLLANEAMPHWNPQSEGGDSTYCVRCLVWRRRTPSGIVFNQDNATLTRIVNAVPSFRIIDRNPNYGSGSGHHCRICQRCVQDFDHHCAFYGRCVTRKNMPYFKGIFSMAYVAGFTLVCFVPVVVWYEYRHDAALISTAVIACVSVCCFLYSAELIKGFETAMAPSNPMGYRRMQTRGI